jgi:hypothetical protein
LARSPGHRQRSILEHEICREEGTHGSDGISGWQPRCGGARCHWRDQSAGPACWRSTSASRCPRAAPSPHVLRGMGLADLAKSPQAIKELADKGMAPERGRGATAFAVITVPVPKPIAACFPAQLHYLSAPARRPTKCGANRLDQQQRDPHGPNVPSTSCSGTIARRQPQAIATIPLGAQREDCEPRFDGRDGKKTAA